MHRRDCLKLLGTIGCLQPISQAFPFYAGASGLAKSDIYIFSKVLQWLDYENLARVAKQIGFTGVDLTVRPKGHVLPENVEKDLPKAVEAFNKYGLDAGMMTTEITDIREPYTEKILKTASQLGMQHYRMGWLKYDLEKSIQEQVESYKPRLKELEQMNEHYQISGGYQNHMGTGVGATVWDIWLLIKDLNPRWLGCQYDIRHAMVEGMNSWEVGFKLLQSNIQSLAFKDFTYVQHGKGWTVNNMPFGEGVINFKQYIQMVNKLGVTAPITLHAEYELGGAEKGNIQTTIPPATIIAALQQDYNRLKRLIETT